MDRLYTMCKTQEIPEETKRGEVTLLPQIVPVRLLTEDGTKAWTTEWSTISSTTEDMTILRIMDQSIGKK